MFPNKVEDGVVGSIAVGTFAKNEVVESGVYGADSYGIGTHLLDSHSYVLDHERIKYRISILETGIIVASIYLTA